DQLIVVNLTSGAHTAYPVSGFNKQVRWKGSGTVLVGQAGAAFSVDLASHAVTPVGAAELDLGLPEPAAIDQRGLSGDRITRGQGPAWSNGHLVVRAADGPPQVVVVLDAASVVRALAVPQGQVTPLGWLDAHTVLLQTDRGVLAWDTGTGQVTSVA